MLKYLKLSNLILLGLIITLFYLSYLNFTRNEKEESRIENGGSKNALVNKKNDSSEETGKNKKESTGYNSDISDKEFKEKQTDTPTPKIKQSSELPENIEREQEKPEPKNGFYKNSVYDYEVKFPKEWPLRVRSREHVSVGHTIPEDGMGAITIEVSEEAGSEVKEAKKEAQKYPGMVSIKEEAIFVAGVQGTKYILKENMSGETDEYILLSKYGRNYLIKYPVASEEINSEKFLEKVDYVLSGFKFTGEN